MNIGRFGHQMLMVRPFYLQLSTIGLLTIREKWEPETTPLNLRLIREARERRGEATPTWVAETEAELQKAMER
jgi:hypothetical protein